MSNEKTTDGPYKCEPNPNTASTQCVVTGPSLAGFLCDDDMARHLVHMLNIAYLAGFDDGCPCD